jgi:nitric oxide reductase NorD protein
MGNDPLKTLFLFDPEFAHMVKERLGSFSRQPSQAMIALLVEETMWGISQELSFGKAVASGYVALLENSDPQQLETYKMLIRKAEKDSGPTLGKIMAEALVPILITCDQQFLEHFLKVVRIMQSKGVYALVSPFGALSSLLNTGNRSAGKVFLHVLEHAFCQDMSYNQCKQIASLLTQVCLQLPDQKKTWVMTELCRVIQADVLLAEPFIESLKHELGLLDNQGLSAFVTIGIEKYYKNQVLGEKFLSLKTQVAVDTCLELQLVVPLKQVQHRLDRYLQAATGLPLRVRPLSSMHGKPAEMDIDKPCVISDGRYLYLPDEISTGDKSANLSLYKVLVRLEAGYYEFQTFEFDFQKAVDRCRTENSDTTLLDEAQVEHAMSKELSDMERFFCLFPNPLLASDLFTVFEHGRIWVLMNRTSPGVSRQAEPFLRQVYENMVKGSGPENVLLHLYAVLAINPQTGTGDLQHGFPIVDRLLERFVHKIQQNEAVETIAGLVLSSYHDVAVFLRATENGSEKYHPMKFPFYRNLYPELYAKTFFQQQKQANQIQTIFHANGIKIYRSEIHKKLDEPSGKLSRDAIKTLVLDSVDKSQNPEETIQRILVSLQKAALADQAGLADHFFLEDGQSYKAFRYHEWDSGQGDYFQDHVLVREKQIVETQGSFYQDALSLHQGLIKQIRYSFELLKPEGLSILRRWREGDEFDYRALLDFAIERKSGITPSERIYMKRIKQVRDVSVLVLVDLSRSTANMVAGTDKSVLTIEKEAIVLLCEALRVVGDSFSIAGFSGTGRLGVDYYPIKEFHEGMSEKVIQRINAMQPLRSTRLGAAIRHASGKLEQLGSKVRLLLIIGDGFPNDNGYKQDYAIQDTRKALLEAQSKNLYAHSITVNIAGDSQLDNLYGKFHHNVISDVCELPDKLLQIYGNLTK